MEWHDKPIEVVCKLVSEQATKKPDLPEDVSAAMIVLDWCTATEERGKPEDAVNAEEEGRSLFPNEDAIKSKALKLLALYFEEKIDERGRSDSSGD